jgi:hypothetical protein
MRVLATILGIVIGLIGLGIDFVEIIPGTLVVTETNPVPRSLPGALIWFWTYFTHLTNLGLVLVYLAVLTGWRWLRPLASPRWMALMGGYILLVMIYYHVALAPLYTFEGLLLVATITLHYVAPIYYLLWWAAFAPHGGLRFAEIGWMLLPGLAYLAWALARGAVVNEYPYDILDAGKFGYGAVAIGVGALLAAVVVFCALIIAADKLLARATRPAPAE